MTKKTGKEEKLTVKEEKLVRDTQSLKLYNRHKGDEYDRFAEVYRRAWVRSKELASQSDLMRELLGLKNHGLTTLEDRLYLSGEESGPFLEILLQLNRIHAELTDEGKELLIRQLNSSVSAASRLLEAHHRDKKVVNGEN